MTIGEALANEESDHVAERSSRGETGVAAPSTPAMAVVHGMATILEADVDALSPIAETIDPDALNQLVETWIDRGERAAAITFEYCRCSVTVTGTGEIFIVQGDRIGEHASPGETGMDGQ